MIQIDFDVSEFLAAAETACFKSSLPTYSATATLASKKNRVFAPDIPTRLAPFPAIGTLTSKGGPPALPGWQ
jgi:hypothetical protein